MANTELDTSSPLTHFQADDVSPPTLTLPPLLLQARPALGRQPSPSSPPKPFTACPLCNLKHNKVGSTTSSSRRKHFTVLFQFHCGDCITRGDFAHSSSALCETLCEKQRRLIALERDLKDTKEQIAALAAAKWSSGLIRENLKSTKTRIKYLRYVIKQQREKKLSTLEQLSRTRESNKKREERLPQFREKSEKMRDFVSNFQVEASELAGRELSSQLELRRTRAEWILSCHDLIFPLLTLQTDLIHTEETDESTIVIMESLADAIQTSYISGRWVSSDYGEGGEQLRLVTGGQGQPSHHQGAATLCLAGQFCSLIAAVLAAPLPLRISWADLGVVETSETRLARKAARLNINLARLCLECGVETGNIKPGQCLHNLHRLVQTLRTAGTVRLNTNISPDQLEALQARLEDYEEEDSGSEEESELAGLPAEWESVSGEGVPSSAGGEVGGASIASTVSNTVSQLLWGPTLSPLIHKK